jgi:hypothetical protein
MDSPRQTVRELPDRSGTRKVVIVRRDDGLFSFEEWKLIPHYDAEMAERLQDYGMVWVPVNTGLTITDSPTAAEREARGAVAWLSECND